MRPLNAFRVFEMRESNRLKQNFVEGHGFKRSRGHTDIARLAGKRGRPAERSLGQWNDHPDLWLRDGKPVCYTAQPYDLDGDDAKELDAVCAELNLHWYADWRFSWHLPGATVLIVIMRDGEHLSDYKPLGADGVRVQRREALAQQEYDPGWLVTRVCASRPCECGEVLWFEESIAGSVPVRSLVICRCGRRYSLGLHPVKFEPATLEESLAIN